MTTPATNTTTAADIAITVDAREFGLHTKQGGWRLGFIVARNVALAPGRVSVKTLAPKTNATTFARKSGTSNDRIIRHLAAWERAADRGLVPHAAELRPGQDTMTLNGRRFTLDAETLPSWQEFYKTPTVRRTPPPAPAPAPARPAAVTQARADALRLAAARAFGVDPAPAQTGVAVNAVSIVDGPLIEQAGRNYRAGSGAPADGADTIGAATRLHQEHADDVTHALKAIGSYARRILDISRDTDWAETGRSEAATELRKLGEQLAMIADITENPNLGRATDAAINQLINGSS